MSAPNRNPTRPIHHSLGQSSSQRPGKAELVTIGIGQVEEPLAPFGIAGLRIGAIAGRDHSRMEGVNVGAIEDYASPPGPLALGRLRDEIKIAGSRPKARECRVLTAVNDLKSQHAVEADTMSWVASVMALMLSIMARMLHDLL